MPRPVGGDLGGVAVEADLDERRRDINIIRAVRRIVPAFPPLGQKLRVHRATRVLAETVGERVAQPIETELSGATCVRSVQERAMGCLFRHREIPLLLTILLSAIPPAGREPVQKFTAEAAKKTTPPQMDTDKHR